VHIAHLLLSFSSSLFVLLVVVVVGVALLALLLEGHLVRARLRGPESASISFPGKPLFQ